MHTPTQLYPYQSSPTGYYILLRDGKETMRGTEQECWQFIHRFHCYSVEHALKYEGYSMEPVQEIVPSPTIVCDEIVPTTTLNLGD